MEGVTREWSRWITKDVIIKYFYVVVCMSNCQYVLNKRKGENKVYFAKTIKSIKFWRVFWHGFLIGYCLFKACHSYPQCRSLSESRQFSFLTTSRECCIARSREETMQFGGFCHPLSWDISAEIFVKEVELL